MLKKAASRAIWFGGKVSAVFGLALAMALVLGVGTYALAAVPGDQFRLGQANVINNAITSLVGSRTGAMMLIDNNSNAADARALDLRAQPGRPPMTVNPGAAKVPNLDADRLDGRDSTSFVRQGKPGSVFAAGQISGDGADPSVVNSVGATRDVDRPKTGTYCIGFSTGIDPERRDSAVVGIAGTGSDPPVFPIVSNKSVGWCRGVLYQENDLEVYVVDAAGNPANGDFSFIVP